MASPQALNKIASNKSWELLHHAPASTSPTVVVQGGTPQWRDLSLYELFAVLATNAVLVGAGITQLEILANDQSDGSGNTVVIADSGVIAADALGDYAFLEVSASQVKQEGEDAGFELRYVAARLTLANAGDVAVASYLRAEPSFATSGLTATTIA